MLRVVEGREERGGKGFRCKETVGTRTLEQDYNR